jgi:esterase/lipase superfamily enzyme
MSRPQGTPSNKAFKLTSASRVEALRATTRSSRSQLNAMFDGRHSPPRGAA